MEQKKAPLDLGLKMLETTTKLFVITNFVLFPLSSDSSTASLKWNRVFSLGQPYRIKEGRIALVKQGVARVSINLIEHNPSRKPIINDSSPLLFRS